MSMLGINKKMERMNAVKITDTAGNVHKVGQHVNKDEFRIHACPTTTRITVEYADGHKETMGKWRFEAIANCRKVENFLRKK